MGPANGDWRLAIGDLHPMPTITLLQPQARRPDRLTVQLDSELTFVLPISVTGGLFVGKEVDRRELESLKAEADFADATDRALRFLAARPRSRTEVQRKLTRHRLPPGAIERALADLESHGLLDDALFALWWVRDRCSNRPRSRHALTHELASRGVDKTAILRALHDVDDARMATDIAVERGRRIAHLPREVFDRRMSGFLERRGFRGDCVRQAVETAWQKREADR